MGRLRVAPDALAVAVDRLVAIVRVAADGAVTVRDLVNGSLQVVSACELSAPPLLARPAPVPLCAIAGATDAQWAQARRREAAVARIAASGATSKQVARAATRLGVTRRTVFRWLARFNEAPQTSSLLARPRGTPPGARRINERLEQLIAEVISEIYLTRVRAKKEEVVRQVALRCVAEGLACPSRKPILARLKALDPRRVAKARLEPGEAAARQDFVPGAYRIDRPLEVIQIDHTKVDVIVVDEASRLPIGRPWLTLAVDVATRVVVGLYVSLDAPSSTSVALCLTQAALPKEAWLKQRDLACPWPVWGLPQAVHADNGSDFTSAAVRRGCDEHAIKLILRPVATPRYGGHIERLIGTLMGRVHLLPGTTGSDPGNKGDYPSEQRARLTLAELERWLTIEICEQYHRRVHKGLRRSPLSAWDEAWRRPDCGSRFLPDHPEQFTISFLPFEQRKLRRDGLHLFNIRYWDPVLPAMVGLGELVTVRYDPRNLSRVYVPGSGGRYHPIPYADLGMPPITLWEQRAAMLVLRREGENAPGQVAMFKAVLKQRDLVAGAESKTKAARRAVQRRKDATLATMGTARTGGHPVDYSQPVAPSDGEVWDD